MNPNAPVNIGTDRQLFVDKFWIDGAKGTTRVLHEPVREAPAIMADRPWDMSPCAGAFIRDGGRFRGWYRTDHDPNTIVRRGGHPTAMDPRGYPDATTAYVESVDGINWEKPNLGLYEIDGSSENNAVWIGPGANMVPFKDPNPDARDDERYKAIVRTFDLLALGSPDGINWHLLQNEPILTDGPFDSTNVSFWDYLLGQYVVYARAVGNPDGSVYYDREQDRFEPTVTGAVIEKTKGHEFGGGVRWIRRATSKDFRSWSELEPIDTGGTPDEHFYTNACVQYERAPGTYLMFPSRFVVERTPDPEWTRSPGVNDIVFMSSRDGLHFDRSLKEAFIRPGLDQRNWHDRGVYIETGILQTSPTELSLYGMENSHLPSQRIRRYSLRMDGFVSVNAGYSGGEFTTRPLTFTGGELELNYSTSAVGSVRVEIEDAEGHSIPGYGLADCPEKFGDEIEGVMSWNAGSGVGDLAGRPIRLRFILRDADLYAFRFRNR